MEYQIQSSVLVDGEWVSRTSDIYQIMARNNQAEDDTVSQPEPKPHSQVPELGILSRTVVESPLAKFILPANIRHKELNDVVIVGEDSVQLKEVRDYGHLRHIASKTNFKGKILAAKVFGEPRQVMVDTSERSPLLNRNSAHRVRRSTSNEDNAAIPPEVIVLTLSSRTLMFLWANQEQDGPVTFCQKTVRLPAGTSRFDQPGPFLAVEPKCRAIAVAAHEDCFMIYRTQAMDQWREGMRAGRSGVPIVDEAVVKVEGRVMHMEFLSSKSSIISLVFIVVHDGHTKLVMYEWDFDSDFPALHVSERRDRYSLAFGEWMYSDAPAIYSARQSLTLDLGDRTPSLLVPLRRTDGFLLVSDRHVTWYGEMRSGPPRYQTVNFQSDVLAPLRPGASKGTPRWVQWARAPRNFDFSKEVFYIAREDGVVVYLELDLSPTVSTSHAGCWPYPIDTAFACLNAYHSEYAQAFPDMLISGGLGSDGHLCRVGAWPKEYAYATPASENHSFMALERVPNWTPLFDMAVAPSAELRTFDDRQRAGIYIANGEAPHGQLSELRRGLKALVDDSFEGMKGCTGVYIVDFGMEMLSREGRDTKHYYVSFIATFPLESMAIRASRAGFDGLSLDGSGILGASMWEKIQLPADQSEMDDRGDDSPSGIIQEEETISACIWNDDYSIQITRNEARSLRRPALSVNQSFRFPHAVLQAVTVPAIPFIAATLRQGNNNFLQIIHVLPDGSFATQEQSNLRFDIPCEPTCLELLSHEGSSYVFIGTTDCLVRLLVIEKKEDGISAMTPVYEGRLQPDSFDEEHMVCESAVLLGSCGRTQLICGTRNGLIVSIGLDQHNKGFVRHSTHLTKIGTTSVRISSCATDPCSAFVGSGSDFCRLRIARHHHLPVDIDSIWFWDSRDLAYSQGPVTAVVQLALQEASTSNGRDLGGFILAVSGERMVFAQLDYDVRWSSHDNPSFIPENGKIIPRSLSTTTTPKRILYLGSGQHVVVATVEYKQQRPLPNGVRTMQSLIKLVNRETGLVVQDSDIKHENGLGVSPRKPSKPEFALKDYERVYSMIEWTYTDPKGKDHCFVIVGTGMEAMGKDSGRRLIFKASDRGLKHQTERVYGSVVRCLAMYDRYQMVFVHGKTLQIEEYDTSAKKFLAKGATELPSAGVHLSVHDSRVFVSTAYDSLMCFQIKQEHDMDRGLPLSFAPVFSDSRQHQSSHHLGCPLVNPSPPKAEAQASKSSLSWSNDSIVLLADKTCSVSGLPQSPALGIQGTIHTLFEASLPRSVIRLQRGDIRPPWRRPCTNSSTLSYAIPGVLADDILGGCSDGTIYAFSILSQPARYLLRLIQNLIEAKKKRDPAVQHSIIKMSSSDLFRELQNRAAGTQEGVITPLDVNPQAHENGPGAARFNHVDGDLLMRFLDEGGDLQELVSEGCDPGVEILFRAAVGDVRRECGEYGHVQNQGVEMFAWATKWVELVLMPLL